MPDAELAAPGTPGTEFAARAPAPALRPYVRSYTGYRQHDTGPAVHRGLPSRAVTLIISLAEPVRVVGGPGTEHGPRALRSAVGGLHLRPALIAQDRYQHGLHLELNPLGVRALLGVSATELSSGLHDLAELPVPWARRLPAMLAEAPDWESRFALLDQQLRGGLQPSTPMAEIQWAWRSMAARQLPVAALAAEIGWSRRHFAQCFAAEVGVSPKQAARLLRFERSAAALRSDRYATLADVATACGYYDQAHLAGEWREFAGCPPSVWIAEELPFLQDPAGGAAPESGA